MGLRGRAPQAEEGDAGVRAGVHAAAEVDRREAQMCAWTLGPAGAHRGRTHRQAARGVGAGCAHHHLAVGPKERLELQARRARASALIGRVGIQGRRLCGATSLRRVLAIRARVGASPSPQRGRHHG